MNASPTSTSPPLRWVVLRHDGVAEPHFDLMIESYPGGPLYTWRCPQNPVAQYITVATRIANHRCHYLDYEGAISGDRGYVTRVASGGTRFERVRARVWLWDAGECALFNGYWMAPVRLGSGPRWLIEGQTTPLAEMLAR